MGKIVAVSHERYNGGIAIKRKYGSSTVTRFYVCDSDIPGSAVLIEGYGPTPGDRKTDAMRKFSAR